MENKKSPDGLKLQILLSVISIFLGLILILVPEISMVTLTYVFCIVLILFGITSIVEFFMYDRYKSLRNYMFSFGVLLVILGCCGLLRAIDLAQRFEEFTGLLILLLAIMILQSSVQLKVLKNGLWIPELIFALVSITMAVIILTDWRFVLDKAERFNYFALVITGCLSLISLLLLVIGLNVAKKKEEDLIGVIPEISDVPETEGTDDAYPVDIQAVDITEAVPDDTENAPEDI